MCRQSRLRSPLARLRRSATDEGFSLVEVLVALLIFGIVAVTALGLLLSALTASNSARLHGVAKNLGQERLEGMRNLPFHIAATVSTAPDLLDTYYTSTSTAAASTSATGFVAAGGARDVAKGDPATGPFFRRVFAEGSIPGYPRFAQRVTAQFMQDDTVVLPNPVFVSTSTGLTGLPPSTTLAVRVTMLWKDRDRSKASTVYSQIAEAASKAPLVTLQARLAMLKFSGILPGNRELVAEAGSLNLDGSLSNSTSASAVAQGTFASIASGLREDGAKRTAAAPPSTGAALSDSAGPKSLPDAGSAVAELSNSAVVDVAASALDGQPGAGSSGTPVSARLLGGGGFGDSSLVFGVGNAPDTTSRLGLLSQAVRLQVPSCGGGCVALQGNGYLASAGGGSHYATAGLSGTMGGTVAVFPTLQSPGGVLQVTLSSFSAVCDSRAGSSPAASASLTFAGTVKYRTYDPVLGYSYSAPISISSSASTDPLAAVPLDTTKVGLAADGTTLYLGDYVQSWSSLTSGVITGARQLASNGSSVSIALPGVLTIASKPLRIEPESTVGLQIASASCVAGDVR